MELTREQRARVQKGLAAFGFDPGPADGMFGPRTHAAVATWREAKGLESTGQLSRDAAEALAAAGEGFHKQQAQSSEAEQAGSKNEILYFAAAGPKCAGMAGGSSCWQEIRGQPGCYVWTEFSESGHPTDWTGACEGDTAHGEGTLSRASDSEGGRSTAGGGSLMSGKMSGHWTIRWADGYRFEGEMFDGLPNGFGTLTFPESGTYRGRFRDGCLSSEDSEDGNWATSFVSPKECGFKYAFE